MDFEGVAIGVTLHHPHGQIYGYPFFARWPYEVHITAARHVQRLPEFDAAELRQLAAVLKTVLVAYDRLFAKSMPYILAVHQAPTRGEHGSYHLHFAIYPPLRTADKLKYLAGSETAAGFFINDTLAEEKAAELRAHCTPAVWRQP